jgi:hypothetical protein
MARLRRRTRVPTPENSGISRGMAFAAEAIGHMYSVEKPIVAAALAILLARCGDGRSERQTTSPLIDAGQSLDNDRHDAAPAKPAKDAGVIRPACSGSYYPICNQGITEWGCCPGGALCDPYPYSMCWDGSCSGIGALCPPPDCEASDDRSCAAEDAGTDDAGADDDAG